jgi:hypothetical protein
MKPEIDACEASPLVVAATRAGGDLADLPPFSLPSVIEDFQ